MGSYVEKIEIKFKDGTKWEGGEEEFCETFRLCNVAAGRAVNWPTRAGRADRTGAKPGTPSTTKHAMAADLPIIVAAL